MAIDSRSNLKTRFKTGVIPTENDFINLIDSSPNLNDDHLTKAPNTPLRIGNTDSLQKMIEFFRGAVSGGTAAWSVGLKVGNNQQGFAVMQGNTGRFFIQENTGNVGIGTDTPKMSLQVDTPSLYNSPAIGGYKAGSNNNNGWLYMHVVNDAAEHAFVWDNKRSLRFGVETSMGDSNGFRNLLRITKDGKVGIGDINPVFTLDVVGSLRVSSSSDFSHIKANTAEIGPFSIVPGYGMVSSAPLFILVAPSWDNSMYAIYTDRRISAKGLILGNADFTEYFESLDMQEIPLGTAVILLDNAQIRPARKGEIPMGVISSTPAIICNNYNEWPKKYLKNEFGQNLTEEVEEDVTGPDGKTERRKVTKPILNPDYDPNLEYVSRDRRPEWHAVGLLGQVHLRKGQPVAPTWVKIKDVSDNVELWLVK